MEVLSIDSDLVESAAAFYVGLDRFFVIDGIVLIGRKPPFHPSKATGEFFVGEGARRHGVVGQLVPTVTHRLDLLWWASR